MLRREILRSDFLVIPVESRCDVAQPVISTLVVVVSDLLTFLKSSFRSRTALLAENLFLREQLAFYQEHKIRPQSLTVATR